MRVALTCLISAELERRLYWSAKELSLAISNHAALCLEAAARLWLANRSTPAIPLLPRGAAHPSGGIPVPLNLSGATIAVMGYVALERGLSLDELLQWVLIEAMRNYEPDAAAIADEAAHKPPVALANRPAAGIVEGGGVPRRAPFDPARHAFSRATEATIAAERPRATVTAEMMGDPAARAAGGGRR